MNFKVKIINYDNISQISFGIHETPWGNCLITESEEALLSLSFYDKTEQEAIESLESLWPHAKIVYNKSLTHYWATMAMESLCKKVKAQKPLLFIGTPFQISVWKSLLELQNGDRCTYQDIAKKIGHPKAVRAVGTAIGKNRISLLVPCHRVLRTGGDIGGYAWGVDRKKLLLDYEQRF